MVDNTKLIRWRAEASRTTWLYSLILFFIIIGLHQPGLAVQENRVAPGASSLVPGERAVTGLPSILPAPSLIGLSSSYPFLAGSHINPDLYSANLPSAKIPAVTPSATPAVTPLSATEEKEKGVVSKLADLINKLNPARWIAPAPAGRTETASRKPEPKKQRPVPPKARQKPASEKSMTEKVADFLNKLNPVRWVTGEKKAAVVQKKQKKARAPSAAEPERKTRERREVAAPVVKEKEKGTKNKLADFLNKLNPTQWLADDDKAAPSTAEKAPVLPDLESDQEKSMGEKAIDFVKKLTPGAGSGKTTSGDASLALKKQGTHVVNAVIDTGVDELERTLEDHKFLRNVEITYQPAINGNKKLLQADVIVAIAG